MSKLTPEASGALTITGIVLLVLVLGLGIVLLIVFFTTVKKVSNTANSLKDGSLVQSMIGNAMLGAIDGAHKIKALT